MFRVRLVPYFIVLYSIPSGPGYNDVAVLLVPLADGNSPPSSVFNPVDSIPNGAGTMV